VKLKRRALLVIGAVALLLAAFMTSPANASYSSCPATNSSGVEILGCLFPDSNGGGNPYLMGYSPGCHNLTGGWANIASSVRNRSDVDAASRDYAFRIRLWGKANCAGPGTDVYPGEQFNLPYNLLTFPLNDDAESWAIYTCCG
jgi:hypothetical protein